MQHVIFFACNQTDSSIGHACNQTGSSIGHASILLHAWSLKNEGVGAELGGRVVVVVERLFVSHMRDFFLQNWLS